MNLRALMQVVQPGFWRNRARLVRVLALGLCLGDFLLVMFCLSSFCSPRWRVLLRSWHVAEVEDFTGVLSLVNESESRAGRIANRAERAGVKRPFLKGTRLTDTHRSHSAYGIHTREV